MGSNSKQLVKKLRLFGGVSVFLIQIGYNKNMSVLLIFIWIYAAMIATSFWEAYIEGRNYWDKGKLGWKIN